MPHQTADSPAYIWKGAPKTLQDRSLPAPRPQPCSPRSGLLPPRCPKWEPRPQTWGVAADSGRRGAPSQNLPVRDSPGCAVQSEEHRSCTSGVLHLGTLPRATSSWKAIPLPLGLTWPCPSWTRRHLLRKGSLGPPITLFSLKSPASSLLQPFLQGNCLLNVSLWRLRPCLLGLPGTW